MFSNGSRRALLSLNTSFQSTVSKTPLTQFARVLPTSNITAYRSQSTRAGPALTYSILPSPVPLNEVFSATCPNADPFVLVREDTQGISTTIREVIGSDHPIMRTIAGYFFDAKKNRTRPTLIFLMAHLLQDAAISAQTSTPLTQCEGQGSLTARHRLLSELAELIHVSMTLHNHVRDDAVPTATAAATPAPAEADAVRKVSDRHRADSLPSSLSMDGLSAMMGKKLVLGGDLLFARVVVGLHALRDHYVTELMTVTLEQSLMGEVLMTSNDGTLEAYEHTAFCRTASLMAHALQATAVLSGADKAVQRVAFDIGKYTYLCGRVRDDIRAYQKAKPGLLTAGEPVPLGNAVVAAATARDATLRPVVAQLAQEGKAFDLWTSAAAVDAEAAAEEMAREYARMAVRAVLSLPACKWRDGMVRLIEHILVRAK